jgi:hypothetical protein
MLFHGRLYHPAGRDFDDMPIPGSDDPSFSSHYLHVVFEDKTKNSYLICSNRKQVGNSTIQCNFLKRRDKVTHVRGLKHLCTYPRRLTDFAEPKAPTPTPDPRPAIDDLQRGVLDFIGSTGESLNLAASVEMKTLLLTAISVGQKFPHADPKSLCDFPSRQRVTNRFIRAQHGREEYIFKSYSKIGFCSLLMDGAKMHRTPYLCVCISNLSSDLYFQSWCKKCILWYPSKVAGKVG